MGKFINMVDEEFERLTVKKMLYQRDMDGRILWACQCKCGNIKITTRHALKNKFVQSCGCLKADNNRAKAKKLNAEGKNKHPKAKQLILELYKAIKDNNIPEELINRTEKFLEKIKG